MAICPFAEFKPIQSHGGVISNDLGLVLHVTTNWFDPWGFFSNPGNGASSTFWVRADGHLEQYFDSQYASWAQAGGNYNYQSIETDGVPEVPLSAAQVETLAQLYAWGHNTLGWALQIADSPGARGLGWHGMGGMAWGGHYGCPGDARRGQRGAILNRAAQILGQPVGPPTPPVVGPVILALGSSGLGVTVLQSSLDRLGYGLVVDGQFGPATEAAVKAFQTKAGIGVDGVVGPQTEAALVAALGRPTPVPVPTPPPVPPTSSAPPFPGRLLHQPPAMQGADVATWQTQMLHRGWGGIGTADGWYGPHSAAACVGFQQEKGLGVDGVVGPQTWAATWNAPVT